MKKRLILKACCSVMIAFMLCISLSDGMFCEALTIPQQFRELDKRIDSLNNKIDNSFNEHRNDYHQNTTIGDLNIPTAAYNWTNIRADEAESRAYNRAMNDLVPRLEKLERNGGGASAQDVTDLKNKVDGTNNKLDQNAEKVDNIQKTLDDITKKSEKSNDSSARNSLYDMTDAMIAKTNDLWNTVGGIFLLNSSWADKMGVLKFFGWSIDIDSYANSPIHTALKLVAYSIVLLFFSITIVESTVKYEMISLKGFIIMTARLGISKLLIDKSGYICLKIIQIVRETIGSVFKAAGGVNGEALNSIMNPNPTEDLMKSIAPSKLPFIGELVDAIVAFIYIIPLVLTALAVMIVAAIIIIRMLLWSVDLAILVSVSPLYISCWSSDVTKQYCKNFIVTFIQASAQLLYMALVYFIFRKWLINSTGAETSMSVYLPKIVPNVIVMIAMAIMMIKPPKFLSNMLK